MSFPKQQYGSWMLWLEKWFQILRVLEKHVLLPGSLSSCLQWCSKVLDHMENLWYFYVWGFKNLRRFDIKHKYFRFRTISRPQNKAFGFVSLLGEVVQRRLLGLVKATNLLQLNNSDSSFCLSELLMSLNPQTEKFWLHVNLRKNIIDFWCSFRLLGHTVLYILLLFPHT